MNLAENAFPIFAASILSLYWLILFWGWIYVEVLGDRAGRGAPARDADPQVH
jgi:hypothetical protein